MKSWLLGKEKWGYDYTFDCTGNVEVMRCALEVAHRFSIPSSAHLYSRVVDPKSEMIRI